MERKLCWVSLSTTHVANSSQYFTPGHVSAYFHLTCFLATVASLNLPALPSLLQPLEFSISWVSVHGLQFFFYDILLNDGACFGKPHHLYMEPKRSETQLTLLILHFSSFQQDKRNEHGDLRKPFGQRKCFITSKDILKWVRSIWWQKSETGFPLCHFGAPWFRK